MNEVKEARTKELEGAIESVFKALNAMGGNEMAKQAAVQNVFKYQHRTLQQNFMRTVILPVLLQLSDQYDNGFYDMRNQAAAEMAAKMVKNVSEEERYLPFV